jgi:uncharacterized membrane protein
MTIERPEQGDGETRTPGEISKASQAGQPVTSNQISASFEYQYIGALPPPSYLKQYEDNHPGFADRLLNLSEREQSHRHQMEELYVRGNIEDQKRWRLEGNIGQALALIVSLVALGGGTYAAVNNAQWPGAIIGASGVGGLAAVFVKGRQEGGGLDG